MAQFPVQQKTPAFTLREMIIILLFLNQKASVSESEEVARKLRGVATNTGFKVGVQGTVSCIILLITDMEFKSWWQP
jgi:hypothetical protein